MSGQWGHRESSNLMSQRPIECEGLSPSEHLASYGPGYPRHYSGTAFNGVLLFEQIG